MIAALRATPWAWATVALLLAVSAQQFRISGLKADLAEARQGHADYVSEQQRQRAEDERASRAEEQRRQREADQQSQKDAQDEQNRLDELDRAGSERDRLQQQVDRLKRLQASGSATDAASFAAERKARQAAFNMLADVYSESVVRGGELAAALDVSRARGLSCEARYDSLATP